MDLKITYSFLELNIDQISLVISTENYKVKWYAATNDLNKIKQ